MKILRLLLVAVGLLLMGYLVREVGLSEVLRNLELIGWGALPLVLLPSLLWHLADTIAWNYAFPPDAFKPPMAALFMARLAGETVNQLTPLANLGGEPLKAYLLRQRTPGPCGMAAVVVDKTAQLIVNLAFTMAGLGLLLLDRDLPQILPVQYLLGFFLLLVLALLACWWVRRYQGRLFTSLFTLLRAAGLKAGFIERNLGRAGRTDASIASFYREHQARFWLALLFHGAGWFMGICETFVVVRVLGAGLGLGTCFLLRSLSSAINGLFFFMPSSIGVMEGSQVLLFTGLGLGSALGLSVGIVKRLRKIFWAFVGWIFLGYLSREGAGPQMVPQGTALSGAEVPS